MLIHPNLNLNKPCNVNINPNPDILNLNNSISNAIY